MTDKDKTTDIKMALTILYAALAKSGRENELFFDDLGWDRDISDKENILELMNEIPNSRKKSFGFSLKSAARDIFWNAQDIAEKIQNCVESLDIKDTPLDSQKDWAAYFDFNNSEVLFEISPREGDNDSLTEAIVGNKEKGWMISFSGAMGEYYDENYDLTISTKCFVNLSAPEFDQEISSRIKNHFNQAFSSFSETLDAIIKETPKDIHIDFSDVIMDAFKSQKGVFKEAFATYEKNLIKKALGYDEGKIPEPSPKAKARGPKKI